MCAAMVALGLSWLLPNHYLPWLSFHQEFTATLALPLLAVGAWAARRGDAPRAFLLPWPALGCLALVAVPWLQWVSGLVFFAGDAAIVSLYLLALGTAILLGNDLGRSARADDLARLFAVTLLLGCIASVGIQLMQWLRVPGLNWAGADMPLGGRPFGNLAQPNLLATLLGIGLAATAFLADRGVLGRRVAALAALFLLFGIALTQSRAALLFLLPFGLAAWRRRREPDAALRPAGLAVLAACFVGAWLLIGPLNEALLLQASRPAGTTTAVGIRTVFWAQLWDAATRAPWTGYGWNQVTVAVAGVARDYPTTRATSYSHNLALDLMLWNGIPLGGLVLAAGAAWFVTRLRRSSGPVAAFAACAISVLLLHGLFEYPFAYLYLLLPCGLLAGLLEAQAPSSAPAALPAGTPAMIAAAAAALLVAVWVDYRPIEDDHRLLRFELADIGDLRSPQPAPDVLLFDHLRAELAYMRTPPRAGLNDAELEAMRRVATRFSSADVVGRYVVALALNGRTDEARRELQRLRKTYGEDEHARFVRQIARLARDGRPALLAVLPAPA